MIISFKNKCSIMSVSHSIFMLHQNKLINNKVILEVAQLNEEVTDQYEEYHAYLSLLKEITLHSYKS